MELGPQHDQDNRFTARMRLHQSWYRAAVLDVPFGTGPQAHHSDPFGNMLRKEDGERGLNFLTPEIAALAQESEEEAAEGIEPHRLRCNMLSCQPMSFNLLGPMALDGEIGRAMVDALLDDVAVSRIGRLTFEYAPTPFDALLGEAVRFDAFVAVELVDGRRGFVSIETKLTEPFVQELAPLDERPSLARWVDHGGAPWQASERATLGSGQVHHLWRKHALAFSLRETQSERFDFHRLVLLRHSLDESCAEAVTTYRGCLQLGDGSFVDHTLDEVARRWKRVVAKTGWKPWLEDFRRRYIRLAGSAEAWNAFSRA